MMGKLGKYIFTFENDISNIAKIVFDEKENTLTVVLASEKNPEGIRILTKNCISHFYADEGDLIALDYIMNSKDGIVEVINGKYGEFFKGCNNGVRERFFEWAILTRNGCCFVVAYDAPQKL